MNSQRLKMIAGAGAFFLVSLAVAVLFGREIFGQAALLREQVTAIEVDRAQQAQLTQLNKLILESADDRTQLESFYLTSQADSIDFLNYVEGLATEQGVSLVTSSASEVEEGGAAALMVEYQLGGTRTELEIFIALLEQLPFVSEVRAVRLQQQTGVLWDATVTLEVVTRE